MIHQLKMQMLDISMYIAEGVVVKVEAEVALAKAEVEEWEMAAKVEAEGAVREGAARVEAEAVAKAEVAVVTGEAKVTVEEACLCTDRIA